MSLLSRYRTRTRAGALILASALALTVPASAFASKAWNVTIKVPNHSPVTCTNWNITITATQGARKLSGKVEYYYVTVAGYSQHLHGNQSAGTRSNHFGNFSGGVFHDTIVWPSEAAAGEKLTLHAVVRTQDGTKTVSTSVTPTAGHKQCKVNGA